MPQLNSTITKFLGIDFIKDQWLKAIAAFKSKEAEFQKAYVNLKNNRDKYYAAGLKTQYDIVMGRGNIIQNSVESVMNASRKIYDYFNTPSNLGAVPFVAAIPIGSIIGITAVIGGFLTLYYSLQKAYTEYNIRQLPVEQQEAARKAVIKDTSAPVGSEISSSIYGIGAVLLIVLILPRLMEKRK